VFALEDGILILAKLTYSHELLHFSMHDRPTDNQARATYAMEAAIPVVMSWFQINHTGPHPIVGKQRQTLAHRPWCPPISAMDQLTLPRRGTSSGFRMIVRFGIKNGGCVGLRTPFLPE
jgi:hypothetical protein